VVTSYICRVLRSTVLGPSGWGLVGLRKEGARKEEACKAFPTLLRTFALMTEDPLGDEVEQRRMSTDLHLPFLTSLRNMIHKP
jgi:hypothetical protein